MYAILMYKNSQEDYYITFGGHALVTPPSNLLVGYFLHP